MSPRDTEKRKILARKSDKQLHEKQQQQEEKEKQYKLRKERVTRQLNVVSLSLSSDLLKSYLSRGEEPSNFVFACLGLLFVALAIHITTIRVPGSRQFDASARCTQGEREREKQMNAREFNYSRRGGRRRRRR